MSKTINFQNLDAAGFQFATVNGNVFLQKGNMLVYYTGGPNDADKKFRSMFRKAAE
jgi:hypothetical protein